MQEATGNHVTSMRDQGRVNRTELSFDPALAELIKEFEQRHDGLAFDRVITRHPNENTRF